MTVYVVTVVESREQVTRVVLGCSAAHDFLAWLISKGRRGTLSMAAEPPTRSNDESQRALALVEKYAAAI